MGYHNWKVYVNAVTDLQHTMGNKPYITIVQGAWKCIATLHWSRHSHISKNNLQAAHLSIPQYNGLATLLVDQYAITIAKLFPFWCLPGWKTPASPSLDFPYYLLCKWLVWLSC